MTRPSSAGQACIRCIDLLGALSALVFLLPALVAASAALWRFRGPPIISRQLRVGQNGYAFQSLGFRTAERDSNTVVGFIYKSHLDMLPQLWNVVRGDLSLVGPPAHEANRDAADTTYGFRGQKSGLLWPEGQRGKPTTIGTYFVSLASGIALLFTKSS